MSIKVAQNDFTIKIKDFDTFKKCPKNVGDLGILSVAKDFEKLAKVQKIAQSGHTGQYLLTFSRRDAIECAVSSLSSFLCNNLC